ncbi:methyl-accepting chemotaxis protein [Mongoliimonas terrestris]|uniref:methyl-accepting chemotaxis protein n=1 Tax=Mongoliimonas terrestris TaxID=1709001 RepID=UPI000A610727|nr:HAMP domain-containing methyl-accepting chemotaxis protein [Mongoliimonas terrestris]
MFSRSLSGRIIWNFSTIAILSSVLAIVATLAANRARVADLERNEAFATVQQTAELMATAADARRSAFVYVQSRIARDAERAEADLASLETFSQSLPANGEISTAMADIRATYMETARAIAALSASMTGLVDSAVQVSNPVSALSGIAARSGDVEMITAAFSLTEAAGRLTIAASRYTVTFQALDRDRVLQEVSRLNEAAGAMAKLPGASPRVGKMAAKMAELSAVLTENLPKLDAAELASREAAGRLDLAYQALDQIGEGARGHALADFEAATARAEETGWMLRTGLTTAAVLIPIFGLMLAFLLARRITRPIFDVQRAMVDIDAGRLDSTVSGLDRSDEIGQMARSVEQFRQNEVRRLELQAAEEARSNRDRERHALVSSLVDDFQGTTDRLLAEVMADVGRLTAAANKVAGLMEDGSRKAESATDTSRQVSENVEQLSVSASELAQTVTDVARQISMSSDTVRTVATLTRSAKEEVAGLSNAAQQIGEVISMIREVAEQTNLLALNATIEAARAGDHGRGFAVVAAEVKELASQTAKATTSIANHVAEIQNTTDRAVNAINRISDSMDTVQSTSGAISAAVEQQAASTSVISQNTNMAADGTRRVAADMDTMLGGMHGTHDAITDVNRVAASVTERTDGLKRKIDSFLAEVAAA